MANPAFTKVAHDWTTLGNEEPLWAILSHPSKEGEKWDLPDFFRTRVQDVDRYRKHPHGLNSQKRLNHVLDFFRKDGA